MPGMGALQESIEPLTEEESQRNGDYSYTHGVGKWRTRTKRASSRESGRITRTSRIEAMALKSGSASLKKGKLFTSSVGSGDKRGRKTSPHLGHDDKRPAEAQETPSICKSETLKAMEPEFQQLLDDHKAKMQQPALEYERQLQEISHPLQSASISAGQKPIRVSRALKPIANPNCIARKWPILRNSRA
jgi:hypothetical protein